MSESEEARWFAEEVLPHEPALRAYLRNRFPTVHDVDDVVQESYFQLLRQQSGGRINSVRAYLFTIAHNTVVRLCRRRQLWSEVPVAELPAEQLQETGERVSTNTEWDEALLAEAIARLPARCREVFKLRVGRGYSHAQIAECLGLSEATVRVQVARGVQKCARFLQEREGVRLA